MDKCIKASFRDQWHVPASQFANKTYNPVAAVIFGNWRIQPESNKPIIDVSSGDPTIFGNCLPPPSVFTEIENTVRDVKVYGKSPPGGFQIAREAVAKYSSVPGALEISWKDVYITSGCSSAIEIALRVLTNPGDNILIPWPGFTLYSVLSKCRHVKIRYYRLLPDDSWNIDLEHLESLIDRRTKVIIMLNPSNPCGAVYTKEHLQDVIKIAEKHRIPILTDEIYESMTYSGAKFYRLAALSENVPVLTCSGLGKRFNVPGWRLGWLIIHDVNGILAKEVIAGVKSLLHDFYLSCSIAQALIPQMLLETKEDFFSNTLRLAENNATYLYNELSKIDGLQPKMPNGAIYMMVGIDIDKFNDFKDDNELVILLIKEQSLYVFPTTCMGCPNYLRIVITMTAEVLKETCCRLEEFCQKHRKI